VSGGEYVVEPPRKRRLTIDELLDQIHEVAQDPDAGPDRFRAGKLLLSMQTSTTMLPEPLDENDVLDRVSRILEGVGQHLSRIAFRRAFPRLTGVKSDIEAPVEIFSTDDGILTPQQREICRKASVSTKKIRAAFPELATHGRLTGTPYKQGPIAQKSYRYQVAVKAMLDRVNRTMSKPLKGTDADVAPKP